MLLYDAMEGQDIDRIVFLIVDQINHGTTSDSTLRIAIARLNLKAASKAMNNSNFAAAFFYSTVSAGLLPPDHWQQHYDLSRSVFLVLGNAAYTDGQIKEATR